MLEISTCYQRVCRQDYPMGLQDRNVTVRIASVEYNGCTQRDGG